MAHSDSDLPEAFADADAGSDPLPFDDSTPATDEEE